MNRQCPCVLKQISKIKPILALGSCTARRRSFDQNQSIPRFTKMVTFFYVTMGFCKPCSSVMKLHVIILFFGSLRRPVSGLGSLELVFAQLDTRFGKVTKYYSSTILIWPRYYLTYAFAVRLFPTWLVRRSLSTLARLASSTLLNSRQGWRRLICQAFAIGAIGGLLSFALLVASSLKRHTIS